MTDSRDREDRPRANSGEAWAADLEGASMSSGMPAKYSLPGDVLCSEQDIQAKLKTLDPDFAREAEFARNNDLLPFLTLSKLHDPIQLVIDIDSEVTSLQVSRVDSKIDSEALNGDIDTALSEAELSPLAEVPNPTLIFSPHHLAAHSSGLNQANVFELYTRGRRITRYDGVSVTWDQTIDRRVWTTNIDTVNFLKALRQDGVLEREDINSVVELGVGGGGISKYLAVKLPAAKDLTATDISSYALMCAARNIRPSLRPDQDLSLYLGKGLRTLEKRDADILIVNPPYIPEPGGPTAEDPYRGTGLIKEVVEQGLDFLNRENPEACIYLGMSSLAERELGRYLADNPQVKAELVGERMEVPLKILEVNRRRDWVEFLQKECGLQYHPERSESDGFEYWHDIFVLKLTRS